MRFFLMAFVIIILASNFAWAVPDSYSITVGPSVVEFQVVDPLGNITGYDPNTNTVIWNIPNTMYRRLTVTDAGDTPPAKNEIYHSFEVQEYPLPVSISPGLHKIKLLGTTTPEQFDLWLNVSYANMPLNYAATAGRKQLIYPNVTWTYEFDVSTNPPANGQLILVKVASSNDLVTDITVAGNLGYLGDTEFVNELINKIKKIEKERLKPEEKEDHEPATPAQRAVKKYQKLLKEITEHYQKPEKDEFIKEEAYTVLKEDLEYIISHIQ